MNSVIENLRFWRNVSLIVVGGILSYFVLYMIIISLYGGII